MQDIIDMELEEYIPLKIIFNRDEEAVEYISYSKDKTSSLEFTVGIKSKLLKRITLLLCKEYSENDSLVHKLVTGGQEGDFEDKLCVSVEMAKCVAKMYYESGQMDASFIWE